MLIIKPRLKEPESPKNIFPEITFISQKPKIEKLNRIPKLKISVLNWKHNVLNAKHDIIAMPEDSPFNPSIKFQEFMAAIIPVHVKQIAKNFIDKNSVNKSDSTPCKVTLVENINRIIIIIILKSLILAETDRVRSSINPNNHISSINGTDFNSFSSKKLK